jgi:hypothetical protein
MDFQGGRKEGPNVETMGGTIQASQQAQAITTGSSHSPGGILFVKFRFHVALL